MHGARNWKAAWRRSEARSWTGLAAAGMSKYIFRGSAGQSPWLYSMKACSPERLTAWLFARDRGRMIGRWSFASRMEPRSRWLYNQRKNPQAEQAASNSPGAGLAGFLHIQMMFAKLRGLRQKIIQRLLMKTHFEWSRLYYTSNVHQCQRLPIQQ